MKILKIIIFELYTFLLELIRFIPGRLGEYARSFIYRCLGMKLGKQVRIQFGSYVKGFRSISVGQNTTLMNDNKVIAGNASVSIGEHCSFNMNVTLNAGPGGAIKIGNNVLIGPNSVLRSSNHAFQRLDIPIRSQGYKSDVIEISDDVWIGANCLILPGVHIGAHAIVAGGAVVTKNVAPYDVVGGVPAKVLRSRKDGNTSRNT